MDFGLLLVLPFRSFLNRDEDKFRNHFWSLALAPEAANFVCWTHLREFPERSGQVFCGLKDGESEAGKDSSDASSTMSSRKTAGSLLSQRRERSSPEARR